MTAAPAFSDPIPDANARLGSSQEAHDGQPSMRPPLQFLRADRLSYMADMISELQAMAQETQCQTLAGILGLAHAEAHQQIQHLAP